MVAIGICERPIGWTNIERGLPSESESTENSQILVHNYCSYNGADLNQTSRLSSSESLRDSSVEAKRWKYIIIGAIVILILYLVMIFYLLPEGTNSESYYAASNSSPHYVHHNWFSSLFHRSYSSHGNHGHSYHSHGHSYHSHGHRGHSGGHGHRG